MNEMNKWVFGLILYLLKSIKMTLNQSKEGQNQLKSGV